jgi:hypothetical protein
MKKIFFLSLFFPIFCFGQWNQLGTDIDGKSAGEESGSFVNMNANGTVVIIGAPRALDAGVRKGRASVFQWNGTSWLQKGSDLVGTSQGDVFGDAVSISSDGNIVAVGAPAFLNPSQPPGYTRVYEWDGSNWIQKGTDIIGESNGNSSGTAVSLSADGNIIAIGAGSNSGANGSFSGHCRVFEWSGTSWVQKGADIDGEAAQDFFGNAVSISASGGIVAVGAAGNDGNGSGSGHVRVFEWNGTNWLQKGIDIDGATPVNSFGSTLALDANGTNFIASGRDGSNGSIGSVKMYTWNGTNWVQKGAILSGVNGSDFFGTSVDINADGSTIIAGTTGAGVIPGYAKVFKFIGGAWVQQGADIIGEVNGDQFGRSASISSNGSIVAVGTPFNDGNGVNAGHVRIFENTSIVPIKLLYFGGNYSNNAVTLNWQFESQTNFSHFVAEKSLDGIVFNSLTNIYLTNTQFYNYTDSELKQGSIYYYRLKLVDNDGKFSYSNIIKIQPGVVNTFSLLGNPVKDNLNITGLKRGATLALYDNAGKRLLQKNIQDQSLSMDISFLPDGVYYLNYSNKGLMESKKIIKQ